MAITELANKSYELQPVLLHHLQSTLDPSAPTTSAKGPQKAASAPMLSLSVVSDSLRPHGVTHQAPLSMGILWAKKTGVDCHVLLQGIFQTQGSNPGLLHCRRIIYCLSHQGLPKLRFLQPVPQGTRAASKTSECPHPSPSLSPFPIKLQLSAHLL